MKENKKVEVVPSYFYDVMGSEDDKKTYEKVKEKLAKIKNENLSPEAMIKEETLSTLYFRYFQNQLNCEEWKKYKELCFEIALYEMGLGMMSLDGILESFRELKNKDDVIQKVEQEKNRNEFFPKIEAALRENCNVKMSVEETEMVWNSLISSVKTLLARVSSPGLEEETKQLLKCLENQKEIYKEYNERSEQLKRFFPGYRIAHLGNLNITGRESREIVKKTVEYLDENKVDYVVISGNLLSEKLDSSNERELRNAKQIAWLQFLNKIQTKKDGTGRMIFINRHGVLEPYDNGAWLSILNQGENEASVAAEHFMELGREGGKSKVDYFVPLHCQLPECSDSVKRVLLNHWNLEKRNDYAYQEVNGALKLNGKLSIVEFGNRWKPLKTICDDEKNYRYVPTGPLTYTVFMTKDGTDLALNRCSLPEHYEMNSFFTSYEKKEQAPKIKIENLNQSKYNSRVSFYSEPKKNMIFNRGIQELYGKTYIPIDILDVFYSKLYLNEIAQNDYREAESLLKLKK